jgi:hypothetical protein
MAEKLSVKIDLSEATPKSETVTSIAPAPPEVVYHYDRIFVALIVSIGILYTVYQFIFSEHNNSNVPETHLQAEQTLSETPDSVTGIPDKAKPATDDRADSLQEEVLTHKSDLQLSADNKEPSANNKPSANKKIVQQQTTPAQETETQATRPIDTNTSIEISTVVDKPEPTEPDLNKPDLNKPDLNKIVKTVPKQSRDKTVATDISKTAREQNLAILRKPGSSQEITDSAAVPAEIKTIPAAIAPVKILSDKLSRVQLTSSVYKKEPVDQLSSVIIGNEERATKIYLFTQLDNSKGSTIEHQWWYNGKLISRRKITAWGNRWRCYSSKNINKYRQGDWLVKVLDNNGKLLAETAFEFKI